jgi:hypothetical protein
VEFCRQNLKESDYLKDLGLDGRRKARKEMELKVMDPFHVAQVRDECQAVVNTIISLLVP